MSLLDALGHKRSLIASDPISVSVRETEETKHHENGLASPLSRLVEVLLSGNTYCLAAPLPIARQLYVDLGVALAAHPPLELESK